MPLYDYKHNDCPTFEVLVPFSRADVPCKTCGLPATRLVSLPARTATLWGDTCFGINGHFDRGLGTRVTSYRHTDKLLEERGLVRESDLGGDMWYERQMDAQAAERKAHKAVVNAYADNIKKFDGDKGLAMAETFPAHQMLKEAHAHDAGEKL